MHFFCGFIVIMNNTEVVDSPSNNNGKIKKISAFRRGIFIISYLSAIPIFIVFVVLFSLYAKYDVNGYISRQNHSPHYQALPEDNNNSKVTVEAEDGRAKVLEEFFASYNSPLQGHAKTIVSEVDKHNIDYRLLPAIAMQESTLCKKIIKDSYNCWGFGIYGGKVTKFKNYDEAIETITRTLSKKYVQNGLEEPHEIVQKYTPSDDGTWANVVNTMMEHIKNTL